MILPSPPQSAEKLHEEALDQLSIACSDVDPRSWRESIKAEAACRAALDACLRAALAERGHVAGCLCHGPGGCVGLDLEDNTPCIGHEDERCAFPAWLKNSS
jgi:hypothetical protein